MPGWYKYNTLYRNLIMLTLTEQNRIRKLAGMPLLTEAAGMSAGPSGTPISMNQVVEYKRRGFVVAYKYDFYADEPDDELRDMYGDEEDWPTNSAELADYGYEPDVLAFRSKGDMIGYAKQEDDTEKFVFVNDTTLRYERDTGSWIEYVIV